MRCRDSAGDTVIVDLAGQAVRFGSGAKTQGYTKICRFAAIVYRVSPPYPAQADRYNSQRGLHPARSRQADADDAALRHAERALCQGVVIVSGR